MTFSEPLLAKVLDGSKTVTRRPVKERPVGQRSIARWEPCRYKAGRIYAVQPVIEEGPGKGRGGKMVGRLRVLSVNREPGFGAVRCEWGGLRREGFKTYAAFEAYLRRLYGEVPPGPVDRILFELVEEVA